MIAYLRGTVLEKGKDFLILMVGDVGYLVHAAAPLLSRLRAGEASALYTHQVIREDAHDLVGFSSMAELEFFWRLNGVSGVGPRMALHLMSLGPVETVRKAVEKGDVAFLESAPGVGRKTAQRVILELKGKLPAAGPEDGTTDEVVSILENLGYPRARVREIAAGLPSGAAMEERVKLALRQLSK